MDQTQCVGLKEKRTGSLCPRNGGGPVLANAWTTFAATTTRKTCIASRSSRLGTRTTPDRSASLVTMSRIPIVMTQIQ